MLLDLEYLVVDHLSVMLVIGLVVLEVERLGKRCDGLRIKLSYLLLLITKHLLTLNSLIVLFSDTVAALAEALGRVRLLLRLDRVCMVHGHMNR